MDGTTNHEVGRYESGAHSSAARTMRTNNSGASCIAPCPWPSNGTIRLDGKAA